MNGIDPERRAIMDIGIDSFAAILPAPATEHHRAEFLDSVPAIILAAAAARIGNI